MLSLRTDVPEDISVYDELKRYAQDAEKYEQFWIEEMIISCRWRAEALRGHRATEQAQLQLKQLEKYSFITFAIHILTLCHRQVQDANRIVEKARIETQNANSARDILMYFS